MTDPLIQTYTYDSLNRLGDANETSNGTQTWRQDFSYDRYGNRNFVEANTSFDGFDKLCNSNTELCATLRKQLNPGINSGNNNRMNSGQDYTYDSAGNTLTDANGQIFVYDSENKQVKASTSSGTVGEYSYDGDGKRVKKYVPGTGETTIFVYDAAGKQIAEYSTVVASANDAKVAYLTADHLGSPRVNTDATGSVIARHDYHPFGEEIVTTARTNHAEYTPDAVRKRFTGYERDNEIGLDYAQARYFNYGHGRFTSPDDFLNDTHGSDPQSWNLYAYVSNNPLRYIDPSGEIQFNDDGTVKTENRRANGTTEFVINGRTYSRFGPDIKGKDGKTYSVIGEVKTVNIFANDGTKIAATVAVGELKAIENKSYDSQESLDKAEIKDNQFLQSSDPKYASYSHTADCHGTTFAKGQVWIDNDQVKKILKGDGYTRTDKPVEGDVGIYATKVNDKGEVKDVKHSVGVGKVDSIGRVTGVTSKGGITPSQGNVSPGPGSGSAWPNPKTKLVYFTQRTKQ